MACSLIVTAWPNPPSFPQDLSLYMNPCPFTVQQIAPLPRVFNLFRTMGTSQSLARRGRHALEVTFGSHGSKVYFRTRSAR
jgi:hypothetical protein